MTPQRKLWKPALLWLLLSLPGFSAETSLPLSKVIDIRQLSPEEAQRGKVVRLRGTITFVSEPGSDFLQDETAGTFFRGGIADSRPGDIVEIVGRTYMGRYLPGLHVMEGRILARGELPVAVLSDYDDLVAGRYHYQRVAIEGIVRSHVDDGDRSRIRIAMASRIVEVRAEAVLAKDTIVVDSRVRVEGLAAGSINRRHQLIQPHLRITDDSNIQVIEPAGPEERIPAASGAELMTFRAGRHGGHRVRTKGVVTAVFPDAIFVRDDTTGYALNFAEPTIVAVGDHINAVGFPQMDHFGASVADAVLASRQPRQSPVPLDLTIAEALSGLHDSDLVAVTALVTDFYRSEGDMMLTLQGDDRAVRARMAGADVSVAVGAWVRVVGVCQVESSAFYGNYSSLPETVTLRMRTSDDLLVVKAPRWWTVQRLLGLLGVLGGVVFLAGLWILALRRQVSRQTVALHDRIVAEAAHQERQRIARDFHDTLEQELAGLSLRLDAAATRAFDEKGLTLVTTSRNLVLRIQAETRNLISDLRTSSEELGDLGHVLREICHCNSERVPVHVTMPPALPTMAPRVVRQLRMIVNECVTNALKHARASAIAIDVKAAGTHLTISVSDDGCGFDSDTETRGKFGHFGCVGIRERCQALGGQVGWTSVPGKGTTVVVDFDVTAARSVFAREGRAESAAIP